MLGVLQRNPRFRRLWLSQTISQIGDSLNRIALLTVIGRLGGVDEALANVGLLFGFELALRMLPPGLIGPFAGPAADRLPRKVLMVASDVLRAGIVLGLLLIDERSELPALYALVFAQMSVSVCAEAARSASLPNTVIAADLHGAYALHSVTWSSTLALGSVLGGVLVDLADTNTAFAIDAATYLGSAWLLLGLALPPTPVQAEPFRLREVLLFRELRRGYLHARERGLGVALFAKTFWGLVGGTIVMLSIAGATQHYGAGHSTSFTTSALFCARFVGTGLGPVLARRLSGTSEAALAKQVSVSFGVGALGYALLPLAPNLTLACLFVTFAHMGGSTLWVASTAWWQRHVEDAYRGRVFAVEFFGLTGTTAASALLSGLLFDATGSFAASTWIVSGALLASGGRWTLLQARSKHALPAPTVGSEPFARPADLAAGASAAPVTLASAVGPADAATGSASSAGGSSLAPRPAAKQD